VQKSISTIPRAPSPNKSRVNDPKSLCVGGEQTHGVNSAKGVAIGDTVAFPRTDRNTAMRALTLVEIESRCAHEKSWLKFAKSMLEFVRSAIVVAGQKAQDVHKPLYGNDRFT
jgi:hypothetical protein